MEKFFLTLGILAFGLFAIWLGTMVRLGKLRWLFLGGSFPVLAPLGAFLIAIPVGLLFIIIGLMMVFPEQNDPLTIPLVILFFAAIILGFWMPSWIQPTWLRWLHENYDHVLGEMLQEASQMGAKEWERATRTQEELEQWADRVAKKHGWQRRHS